MTFTLVKCDDWEGLYADDTLLTERHAVGVVEALRLAGVRAEAVYADAEWMGDRGNLPESLADVKRDTP